MFLISNMFALIIFLSLNMIFSGRVNTTFVSIGDYPNYRSFGVNLPECGLSSVPIVNNITYQEKCFAKKYPNHIDTNYHTRKTQQKPQQRIYKGLEAKYGEAPWAVQVYGEIYKAYFSGGSCTGVLVTFEWVLTAAHCVATANSRLYVMAGSNTRGKGEYIYTNPKKWFPHPLYTNQSSKTKDEKKAELIKSVHDIALVKLTRKYNPKSDGLTYLVNTVCMPKASNYLDIGKGESATFFGFGIIEGGFRFWTIDTDKLLKFKPAIKQFHECKIGHTICSEEYSAGQPFACDDDSGGPLVQYVNNRAVLAGTLIGSHNLHEWYLNTPCNEENVLDNFWSAVPRFMDWILETISKN